MISSPKLIANEPRWINLDVKRTLRPLGVPGGVLKVVPGDLFWDHFWKSTFLMILSPNLARNEPTWINLGIKRWLWRLWWLTILNHNGIGICRRRWKLKTFSNLLGPTKKVKKVQNVVLAFNLAFMTYATLLYIGLMVYGLWFTFMSFMTLDLRDCPNV